MEPPKVAPIKFDQVLSREAANKPFIKEPQGAPFWKYNVKDDVIVKPVISYKISQNPAASHENQLTQSLPETLKNQNSQEEFTCGRIKKRLEALKDKYEDLAQYNDAERFEQAQIEIIKPDTRDLIDDDTTSALKLNEKMSEIQSQKQLEKLEDSAYF